MIILALDACLGACSAAVRVERGGAVRLVGRHEARRTGHAEALPGMIAACAAEAGIELADVDRIAVTRGPGTFTGVRIGVSAARALALATGAEIVAMTSLALVAATARAGDPAPRVRPGQALLVAAPGPHGCLYVQRFDARGAATSEACALEPEQVLAALGPDTLVIGPAAPELASRAAARGLALAYAGADVLPDARVLADIASGLEAISGPLLPLYLKAPDARPQDDKSLPRLP